MRLELEQTKLREARLLQDNQDFDITTKPGAATSDGGRKVYDSVGSSSSSSSSSSSNCNSDTNELMRMLSINSQELYSKVISSHDNGDKGNDDNDNDHDDGVNGGSSLSDVNDNDFDIKSDNNDDDIDARNAVLYALHAIREACNEGRITMKEKQLLKDQMMTYATHENKQSDIDSSMACNAYDQNILKKLTRGQERRLKDEVLIRMRRLARQKQRELRKFQQQQQQQQQEQQRAETDEEPHSYRCPITSEVMIDPVMTSDGHSYEREAIESWFARGNRSSPNTGLRLSSTKLVPNFGLRNAIEEFKEKGQQS